MRVRFTLPTLILVVSVSAWLISLTQPGSTYVHLPLGLGLLLLVFIVIAGAKLIRNSGKVSERWKYWSLLTASGCVLVGMLVFYPPFWSLAVDRYEYEQFVSNQRQYVLQEMPAEEVRDSGRRLFDQLSKLAGAERFLMPNSKRLPDQIRTLRPRYVWAHPDYLFVYLGKEREFYALRIYPEGAEGCGRVRLAPGIWFMPGGTGRLITESEWDAGIRQ